METVVVVVTKVIGVIVRIGWRLRVDNLSSCQVLHTMMWVVLVQFLRILVVIVTFILMMRVVRV